MANPYLPNWEYIPDGEPRVFGDRIYVYGSHDRKDSIDFCDYKLKVWSAPVSDPTKWVCHGDIFRSRDGHDSPSDVDWTDELLFAPDVVERGGKYYLYAYIVNAKGCVAVADRPEGPFRLLSRYEYDIPNHYDNGTFIDPGVLVDDDGRVYIYCGYQGSYMCELKDNMYEAVPGSYKLDIIPTAEPHRFFEACSPRKINGTYYLIYSPQRGSCLDYATSDSPTGPFTYRGTIIDNGIDFPGGNDHGSVCCVNGQWYIFYHRMTNGTIMSRRGCVERIEILPDGTIPQVETVRFRWLMFSPFSSVRSSMNLSRLSKLSIGSPVPITTTFATLSPVSLVIRYIWSNISDGVSPRTSPSNVDAQNRQPIRQPTCEEMQTELPCLYRIRTLSITFPSSNANRYFLVPSIFEICTASCFKLTKRHSFFSFS